MNLKETNLAIKAVQEQIDKLESNLKTMLKDRITLKYGFHKFKVGQSVELIEDWNTEEKRQSYPGWDYALHFMHPGNKAIVKDVHCHKDVVSYIVKFEEQTCTSYNGESYVSDDSWEFKEDQLREYTEKKEGWSMETVTEGLFRCNSIKMQLVEKDDKQWIELHLFEAKSCDVDKTEYKELICEQTSHIEFNTGFSSKQVSISMVDKATIAIELMNPDKQQFKVGKDKDCWFITIASTLQLS